MAEQVIWMSYAIPRSTLLVWD